MNTREVFMEVLTLA